MGTEIHFHILTLMIRRLNKVIIDDNMIYLGLVERGAMTVMRRWKFSLNMLKTFAKINIFKRSWRFF